MNTPTAPSTGYTNKTSLVGREKEIQLFQDRLMEYNASDYLYFVADGGIGKTRLLRRFLDMVKEAGEQFRCTEIIDLFHTDTHSTSDIERAIVENIDPGKEYFKSYRDKRKKYELLREMGTDPGVLEKRREDLSATFVQEWNDMARKFHKLVLLFDTLEQLQYESSIVEDMAGLDTVDARVKPWILNKLSRLVNVLVVFAGRPKQKSPDQIIDHQAKLEKEMRGAFGASLEISSLAPLSLEQVKEFIQVISDEQEIIPEDLHLVVYRLTQGKPIFLHLIFDLIRRLEMDTKNLLDQFRSYKALEQAPEDAPELTKARKDIEKRLVKAIFNSKLGWHLRRLGMMPKGINLEILKKVLGMPEKNAQELLDTLRPLSFVKTLERLEGGQRLHEGWIFLHDEMYRLINLEGVVQDLPFDERFVANSVVTNYYDPQIAELQSEISKSSAEVRIGLREKLQKLQVERLYYVLVQNPSNGFEEYKRLSHEANRHRWVGFGMRLLDEFMRFYNDTYRRGQFIQSGIDHFQVVRESAELWVERFYWWGQNERAITFAKSILDKPKALHIRPDQDLAILVNICALWGHKRSTVHGYETKTVQAMISLYDRLVNERLVSPHSTLARARMANALGFQYRKGGLLEKAANFYIDAKNNFRDLAQYQDELALVLNNLSFVYAKQGRWAQATALVKEAYKINKSVGTEYSLGLTLSTEAAIERLRGNYAKAIECATEALDIFQELGDNWGIVLARQNISFAKRRMAKSDIEVNRYLERSIQMLEDALGQLEMALSACSEFPSLIPSLHVEMGRVNRELGRALKLQSYDKERESNYHHKSRDYFRKALASDGWVFIEKVDAQEDLAEEFYYAGLYEDAYELLQEIERSMGADYLIIPGKHLPSLEGLANEYFWPLGKVERLRGEMAFDKQDIQKGLQHFCKAFAYFERFSPSAAEIDTMIQFVYSRLQELPSSDQRSQVEAIAEWGATTDLGTDISSFIKDIKELIGP